jgi:hypothetical protein
MTEAPLTSRGGACRIRAEAGGTSPVLPSRSGADSIPPLTLSALATVALTASKLQGSLSDWRHVDRSTQTTDRIRDTETGGAMSNSGRPIARHFLDPTGRGWAIRELTPGEVRRVFPGEIFFEDPPTVSLVFVSTEQRRYLAHAPAHWHDCSFTKLMELLRRAVPLPELQTQSAVDVPRGPRRFLDTAHRLWSVRECRCDGRIPGARGSSCLVFETDGVTRRVWQYPEHWQQLTNAELEHVSSGT